MTASGSPINVMTVLLAASPMSVCKIFIVLTAAIAPEILLIMFMSRPSLKFGTHSRSFMDKKLIVAVKFRKIISFVHFFHTNLSNKKR